MPDTRAVLTLSLLLVASLARAQAPEVPRPGRNESALVDTTRLQETTTRHPMVVEDRGKRERSPLFSSSATIPPKTARPAPEAELKHPPLVLPPQATLPMTAASPAELRDSMPRIFESHPELRPLLAPLQLAPK